jgi:hypothetical protein
MAKHESQHASQGDSSRIEIGQEVAVGRHESHSPGPVLAVKLGSDSMRWQSEGGNVSAPIAFQLMDDTLDKIQRDYHALDALAERLDDGKEFKDLEEALGRVLGNALLQADDGRDNELANRLNELLSELDEGEYVRLLLSFEDARLGNLPWELTWWESAATGKEIALGRHGDIALSRLERPRPGVLRRQPTGRDGVLSILHIGTDDMAPAVFDRTSAFIRRIDEHIPQVHTASRQSLDLNQYWLDCFKILGRHPEIDIVHWDGHGSGDSVRFKARDGSFVTLSAAELLERTRGAFLYVVQSCRSGGDMTVAGEIGNEDAKEDDAPPPEARTFSSALLDHGASAVLGMHDAVAPDRFQRLPILYALLSQGLPLDHCVQYMRRFFWLDNAERQNGRYEPWYKLMLRTNRVEHLDGAPPMSAQMSRDPILILDALATRQSHLAPDDTVVPGPPRAAPDPLLKRLYDAELMK